MRHLVLYSFLALCLAACAPNPMGDSMPDTSAPNISQSLQGEAEIEGPDVVVVGTTGTYNVIDADGNRMTDLSWTTGDGTETTLSLKETLNHTWNKVGQFTMTATYYDNEGAHTVTKVINVIEDTPALACAVESKIIAPRDAVIGSKVIAKIHIGNCLAKYVRTIRWMFIPGGATFEGPSAQRTLLTEGMHTITVEIWVDDKRLLILTKPVFTKGVAPK